MAFLDKTKREISFKKLVGRDHSTNIKEFFEEGAGGGVNVHASGVWVEAIPVTAPGSSTAVVTYYGDFTLTEDTTVNNKLGWEALESSVRLRGWIPPKFGNYTIRLFEDDGGGFKGNEVASSSLINWFFDYETGYLSIENTSALVTPFHVVGYRYIGEKLEDTPVPESADNRVRYLSFTLPTASDKFTLGFEERAITIDNIFAETDSGTINFDVEHRGFGDAFIAGSNILITPIIANSSGVISSYADFQYAEVPEQSWLVYIAKSVSGATEFSMAVSYTVH